MKKLLHTLALLISVSAFASSGSSGSGTSASSGTGTSTACGPGGLPFPCKAPTTPTSGAPVWKDPGATPNTGFFNITPSAYNAPFIEPNSGLRLVWVTTSATNPWPNGDSSQLPSYNGQWAMSNDGQWICVNNAPSLSNNGIYCFPWNETTLQANVAGKVPAGATPIQWMPTSYTFNRSPTNQHTLYGISQTAGANCGTVASVLKSYNIDTTTESTVIDFCDPTAFPGLAAFATANSTQVEVTTDVTGTVFELSFVGVQNNVSATAVYFNATGALPAGCGVWFDWATGNIHAATACGFSASVDPNNWTAGLNASYLCQASAGKCQANKGLHRGSLDADGKVTFAENQTFTTGEVVLDLTTLAAAWNGGSAFGGECDNNPSAPNCGNHHAFNAGQQMFNGQGTVGGGSAIRSWTVRGTNSPNSVGYPPGYSSLSSTYNLGVIPAGTASHDSCTGIKNYPCFDMAYYSSGSSNVAVAYPTVQECDLVSVNPSAQQIWRLVQHHLKSGYGSITKNAGVTCTAGACSATTSGPHSFSGIGTVNTQTAASGSCSADCVIWQSGSTFQTPSYNGTSITINGSTFTVAASGVKSATLLQLTTDPGNHNGVAFDWEQNSVRAYNCSNSALNASGLQLNTTPSGTTFTYTDGTVTGTGDCEFVIDNAIFDFYATSEGQISGTGKTFCFVDNWERSLASDSQRSQNACNGNPCPRLDIICGKIE